MIPRCRLSCRYQETEEAIRPGLAPCVRSRWYDSVEEERDNQACSLSSDRAQRMLRVSLDTETVHGFVSAGKHWNIVIWDCCKWAVRPKRAISMINQCFQMFKGAMWGYYLFTHHLYIDFVGKAVTAILWYCNKKKWIKHFYSTIQIGKLHFLRK